MHHEWYAVLAAGALALHLIWLLFVVFGAMFTAGRPLLTAVHIAALVWGIAVEVGPWPCPLTAVEQHFQTLAGQQAYAGGFLVHYLDRLVYPDIPATILVSAAVAVCGFNLGVYAYRFACAYRRRRATRPEPPQPPSAIAPC